MGTPQLVLHAENAESVRLPQNVLEDPRLKLFDWINGLVSLLFLASAALQWNDPDPLAWIAIYLVAALACWLPRFHPRGWTVTAAVAAISSAWAIWLSPILTKMRLGDLMDKMKAENPRIELSREFLGLAIIAIWMALVAWQGRRRTR